MKILEKKQIKEKKKKIEEGANWKIKKLKSEQIRK